MGYRVKLTKKDGGIMDNREYLCFRDINNDGGGYTRSTIRHATVFDTKEEAESDRVKEYADTLGYLYKIEEV